MEGKPEILTTPVEGKPESLPPLSVSVASTKKPPFTLHDRGVGPKSKVMLHVKTFHESKHGRDFNKLGHRQKVMILNRKMCKVDALKAMTAVFS